MKKALNKASGLFIPAGRVQHFQPTLPASTKSLADERGRKRRLNPADETLYDLNKQIQILVVENKRTKWQSAVDKCDHRIGISHLWWFTKGLSGKKTHKSPNKDVQSIDKTYRYPKKIANKFVHQFTQPSIHLAGDKSKRQLKQHFHQLPLTRTPTFMLVDTKEAIRLAKSSTAIKLDWMSTLNLKKLAHGAINYLTNIFNLSISIGQISEIWHKAIIIPILKHGMDNIGKNWWPISLVCPAAKTLEKHLLPKILTHIHFHPTQHGFRPKHSICTAMLTITADIADGFTRKKTVHRTVLVALDLTAAIDKVGHQQLPDCIHNTYIPATICCWIYNYMQNRRAKVYFQQQESKSRKVKTGVVQGRVLSPALFNYYLADFPTPPPNIKLIKYADDIAIYTFGPVMAGLFNGLNIYLSKVLNYIQKKNGNVNAKI